MKPSPVIKRSIDIGGHKTSISLEDAFWNALKDIAHERRVTVSQLVTGINGNRRQFANLSSALRLFVLEATRNNLLGLSSRKYLYNRPSVGSGVDL